MRLTGSKFGLARRCQYWCRPEVEAPRVESEAARLGTDRHRVLELLAGGHGEDETIDFPALWDCEPGEWPAVLTNILEWLPRPDEGRPRFAAEQQFGLDYVSSEAWPIEGKDRDYPPDGIAGAIYMTVDWVGVIDGVFTVVDYKTGSQRELEPPVTNGQVAICCLAAAKAQFGSVDTVRGILAVVADDGTCRAQYADFDVLDLDAIADDVRSVVQAIPTSRPNPGPWCSEMWCPARSVCPAMTAAIVGTPAEPLSLVIDSAEQCARAHVQLALAEEFLESVKRARNAWLQSNDGCDLPDGKRLVWTVQEKDSIACNESAGIVIRNAGLGDAIEEKTSKAALERAAKKLAGKEWSALHQSVLASLEQVGAIRTSSYGMPATRKARK